MKLQPIKFFSLHLPPQPSSSLASHSVFSLPFHWLEFIMTSTQSCSIMLGQLASLSSCHSTVYHVNTTNMPAHVQFVIAQTASPKYTLTLFAACVTTRFACCLCNKLVVSRNKWHLCRLTSLHSTSQKKCTVITAHCYYKTLQNQYSTLKYIQVVHCSLRHTYKYFYYKYTHVPHVRL